MAMELLLNKSAKIHESIDKKFAFGAVISKRKSRLLCAIRLCIQDAKPVEYA